MKIYANANGNILRVLSNDAEERMFGPPDGYADMVELDEDTNAAVVAELRPDPSRFTVANGKLKKNGQNVTLAAQGSRYADVRQTGALLAKLDNDQALTAGELRVLLRVMAKAMREKGLI